MITSQDADYGVKLLLRIIKDEMRYAGAEGLHIVVMNPREAAPLQDVFCTGAFENAILHEAHVGDPKRWRHPYKQIARKKAFLTWRTGIPSSTIQSHMPHLLLPGDVLLGGSVNLDGIIVATSGLRSHQDEMVSMWIAAYLKATAIKYKLDLPTNTLFLPE